MKVAPSSKEFDYLTGKRKALLNVRSSHQRCSYKFRKIHRKTTVPDTLF